MCFQTEWQSIAGDKATADVEQEKDKEYFFAATKCQVSIL